MARNVKVVMSPSGSRELLNSVEVQVDLLDRAQAIKKRAESVGSGEYDADVRAGANRAHAMVKTPPGKSRRAALARASNAKHNTLLKSIDAGR
ncbi:hypothetical protein [Gordonibacter massiliensis (ex Traore et al. 2017)]|uniref:hypothetical protein n=1 Tax=Gordonibacter massiliensis (ex Traore et al. 2017) TaxID=1841863 RepID=UPI001C8B63E9|nr:hypothetical protein [Gordonibacter massiliensis (ex Traore et al. 2017)]MBX9035034.1 hypothetical protein [Gordonibacter massiliensis (ex Traore et al. 2017)]